MIKDKILRHGIAPLGVLVALTGCGGSSSNGAKEHDNITLSGAPIMVQPSLDYPFAQVLEDGFEFPEALLVDAKKQYLSLLNEQYLAFDEAQQQEEVRTFIAENNIFNDEYFDGLAMFQRQHQCLSTIYAAEIQLYDVLSGWTLRMADEGYILAAQRGFFDVLAHYNETVLAAVVRPFEAPYVQACPVFEQALIDPHIMPVTPQLAQEKIKDALALIINTNHRDIRVPLYMNPNKGVDGENVYLMYERLSAAFLRLSELVGEQESEYENSLFALLKELGHKRPRQRIGDISRSLQRVSALLASAQQPHARLQDQVADSIYSLVYDAFWHGALAEWAQRRLDKDEDLQNAIKAVAAQIEMLKPENEWEPRSSLFNQHNELSAEASAAAMEQVVHTTKHYLETLPKAGALEAGFLLLWGILGGLRCWTRRQKT